MSKTTIERLKNTVSEANNLSDDILTMHIEDAYLDVQEARFPEKHMERANRYLAAHMVVLANKYVKSEEVGALKRSYSDTNSEHENLMTSPYGQEYLRLKKEHTRNKVNLVVI